MHGTQLCNDCHTTHEIDSPLGDAVMMRMTSNCGDCHQDAQRTYRSSYHGQLNKLGYTHSAKCFDCHGGHGVRGEDDPTSSIHQSNRLETCRTCHADAPENFLGFHAHAHGNADDFDKYPGIWITAKFMQALIIGYGGLARHGVAVVAEPAVAIDPHQRLVQTAGGTRLAFDACVVSPGVDFKWDAIEGYDEAVAERIPHAWYAGAPDPHPAPADRGHARGRPGAHRRAPQPLQVPPYERASQTAMCCRHHKPRAKIIVLDAKDAFSKQGLFVQGWTQLYGYASGPVLQRQDGGCRNRRQPAGAGCTGIFTGCKPLKI